MKGFHRPLSVLVMLLTVASVLTFDASNASPAAPSTKTVLVLYSSRSDTEIAFVGERELPDILQVGLRERLDYYSEYIDSGRFPDSDHQKNFRDFLLKKYQGLHFDLVIAIQNSAVNFVDVNRQALFPDTPVVFLSNDPGIRRPANSSGVIAEVLLMETLELAIKLQPDVRQVFFVSGAGELDKPYERRARAQFRSFEPRLAATYLSGLTMKELETRLSNLPAHSIVYYLLVYQDGAGENVHPLKYVDRVAAVANRPTYCWVDSAMEHGIVGGSLLDQKAQLENIGMLSLRVLHGEHADAIPLSRPRLEVNQVDWRQLQRWNISEARVPDGTVVRFRTPGVWQRYKVYIVGAIALLLSQTALIAGLLIQAAKRRRAEDKAHRSQEQLRTSYERIHDLGGRLLSAQETERSHIARELHDDISQQVALLAIDLDLQKGSSEVESSRTGEFDRQVQNRLEGIARSLHDLSHRLHPAKLRLIGLVATLDGMAQELSRGDFNVKFTHENVPSILPAELTLCLFRIAQEAVQNAVRHSGARAVSMHLKGERDGLLLIVADDGRGFEISTLGCHGLGLISMHERVDAIGGTLDIRSKPGEGTRLEARVAFPAAQSMTHAAS